VAPDGVVCYPQTAGDAGTGTVSQTSFDGGSYDSYGADDFTLARNCRLSAVIAIGHYVNGTGTGRQRDHDDLEGRHVHTAGNVQPLDASAVVRLGGANTSRHGKRKAGGLSRRRDAMSYAVEHDRYRRCSIDPGRRLDHRSS
jgi:hypothetical protein